MTTEEAIKWFEAKLIVNQRFGLLGNQNEAAKLALDALRAQMESEQGCDKCSGIMYRQTTSGKIIPIKQKCCVKITPPCYQPDGDGCAYQVYGDDNDEPIERCKECPLCHSDKVRHHEAEGV